MLCGWGGVGVLAGVEVGLLEVGLLELALGSLPWVGEGGTVIGNILRYTIGVVPVDRGSYRLKKYTTLGVNLSVAIALRKDLSALWR